MNKHCYKLFSHPENKQREGRWVGSVGLDRRKRKTRKQGKLKTLKRKIDRDSRLR